MLPAILNMDTEKRVIRSAQYPAGPSKRLERRTIARNRANSRVVTHIPDDILRHDPLVEPRRSWYKRVGTAGLFLLIAVGLELLTFGASSILGFDSTQEKILVESVIEQVTIVSDEQKPLRPVEVVPEVAAEVVGEVTPASEPEVKTRTRTRPKVRKVRPDPINESPPEEVTPVQPRRRVIGINLGSTIRGGTGASFAVGNTRMGRTDDRAVEARSVKRLGLPFTHK